MSSMNCRSCRWLLLLLMVSTSGFAADDDSRWSIVVHGGAGLAPTNFTKEENQVRKDAIRAVLEMGQQELKAGGTALDTVEKVIRALEDDPQFNAGRGAVFNAEGKHELDASIMEGNQLRGGAVAGVTIVRNPISLARKVMSETNHVLLAGAGADRFARDIRAPIVDNGYFSTKAKRATWDKSRTTFDRPTGESDDAKPASPIGLEYKGTVGCVVLDTHGDIAAGTSTGGLTNKKFGRVGDSPILGAGTYAKNQTCGVSCTGVGELYIRNAVAYQISARMEFGGQSLREAAEAIINEILPTDSGGLIALDHRGEVVTLYNTKGMACGSATHRGDINVHWDVE